MNVIRGKRLLENSLISVCEAKANNRAIKTKSPPDFIFQKAAVGKVKVVGVIGEKSEGRRRGIALPSIADDHVFPVTSRRMCGNGSLYENGKIFV